MNDYDSWQWLGDLLRPVLEFAVSPLGTLIAVAFISYHVTKFVRGLGLFVRMPKVDKRTRSTTIINMGCVEEWMLASDEELATLDWRQLRKLLDSRNIHCDAIIELTVLLDDPIYRDGERRKKIEDDIRKLRLAPLRELEEQADSRRQEILQAIGY